MAKISLRIGY